MECGIGLGGFNDLKEGDLIEAFSTEKLAADLGALTSAKEESEGRSKLQASLFRRKTSSSPPDLR
jgi:translation initiation factor IF-2